MKKIIGAPPAEDREARQARMRADGLARAAALKADPGALAAARAAKKAAKDAQNPAAQKAPAEGIDVQAVTAPIITTLLENLRTRGSIKTFPTRDLEMLERGLGHKLFEDRRGQPIKDFTAVAEELREKLHGLDDRGAELMKVLVEPYLVAERELELQLRNGGEAPRGNAVDYLRPLVAQAIVDAYMLLANIKWPKNIVLVRHGESILNAAARNVRSPSEILVVGPRENIGAAVRREIPKPDKHFRNPVTGEDLTTMRDRDIPLTAEGMRQAEETGIALSEMGDFQYVMVSPHIRARRSWNRMRDKGSLHHRHTQFVLEERLRDRDMGALFGYTHYGIQIDYPEEYARYQRDGKYLFRPIGGENYEDVRARVFAVLAKLVIDCPRKNALLVSHDVPILMFRRILEGLGEEAVIRLKETDQIKNCGVVHYAFDIFANKLMPILWNGIYYRETAGSADSSTTVS